jgi:3-deoxy-D-manno-octulosonate 8-phosphate phosphatase (KDO 8-P phosphatase)
MEVSYKELMPQIDTLIFDVDGVLTNGMVTIFPDGQLVRQMNIKDGYALKTAVDAGYKVCIISGGSNEAVRTRLQGLGLTDIYLGAHDKIKQYHEIIDKYNLLPENILYMGDDVPDYPVMELVGFPCAPQDAAHEIKGISKYISPKKGGEGCVRDVIEQIMRVQGKWKGKFYAKFD